MEEQNDILFTKEVMGKLRYSGVAAFYRFLAGKDNGFPKPFKIGRRNAWYKEDVQNWLEEQRRKAAVQ